MNKETIKKLKTGIMKAAGIAVIGAGLVTFAACNQPGQTNTPVNPNPGGDKNPGTNPNPPVVNPIEKTVTVDKIYAENFSTTSFDADIQTAQKSLAGRVFDGQQPQITNINYDENLKELTFAISFVENNETKSGSMTFAAPTLFQQIRGKQAKAVVLEIAELSGSTEIKEANVDEVIDKLETIILNTKLQIASSFASIQKSDVKIERPVEETVTFDELYNQVFGENYTLPSFGELMNNVLPELATGTDQNILFTGFEGDDFYIYFTNTTDAGIKGLRRAKCISNDLDKILSYRQIFAQARNSAQLKDYIQALLSVEDEVEKNSDLLNQILIDLSAEKLLLEEYADVIESLKESHFEPSRVVLNNSRDINNHKEFAEKLFPDKDIIYAGVSALKGEVSGNTFGTGYINTFSVLSVYKDDENIKINTKEVIVPWYSDSTTESQYNSFLKAQYKVTSDKTLTITDPIEVQRLEEYVSKTEKFAQYEITGLDAIAQSEEEEKRLYDNAYEALWLSM